MIHEEWKKIGEYLSEKKSSSIFPFLRKIYDLIVRFRSRHETRRHRICEKWFLLWRRNRNHSFENEVLNATREDMWNSFFFCFSFVINTTDSNWNSFTIYIALTNNICVTFRLTFPNGIACGFSHFTDDFNDSKMSHISFEALPAV